MAERFGGRLSLAVLVAALAAGALSPAHAQVITGDVTNFAVLYEGNGNNQLSQNGGNITGNIGIGDPSGSTTAFLNASGPGTITGNIEYSGAVPNNNAISNTILTGTVSGGNTNVQADLNALNALSTTLGALSGTSLSVNLNNNQTQTINESSGTLHGTNEVFTLSSFNFGGGSTLTIMGDGSGNSVVINVSANVSFGGTIVLSGGLAADDVLFNVIGSNHTLQTSANGATETADFLDPLGTITVDNTIIDGRIFGGDSTNMQLVSGTSIYAPASQSTPVPEPASMVLLGTGIAGLAASRRHRRATASA